MCGLRRSPAHGTISHLLSPGGSVRPPSLTSGLYPPPRSRPAPLPPQGLPAILPMPRRVPATSRGPWANATASGLEEQCAPLAAASGAPPTSPSGSTNFLPFLSRLCLPSLTPRLTGGMERGRAPQTLRAGISPQGFRQPPWRTPYSGSHWRSLQLCSHSPTSPAPLRQASESPSTSLLYRGWPSSSTHQAPAPPHCLAGPSHQRPCAP